MNTTSLPRPVTCCFIIINALFAGGIFIFPILSPALVTHLQLTQPQLTTIVLAGMIGQYPFSVLVGHVIDHHGPAVCSLIASVLFSTAFGCFSFELSNLSTPLSSSNSSYIFYKLTTYFFIAGLGTVFSQVYTFARCFPNHPGVASGMSTAAFGLSPLFLSLLASSYFTTSDGLQIVEYLRFLAISAGVVHLCGVVTLRVPRITVAATPSEADERTSLLPSSDNVRRSSENSLRNLLLDPFFWILFMICLTSLGYCEMVISNIGTIVLSLVNPISNVKYPAEALAARQVRLLSLSNTVSRILVGPLADFVSPIASYNALTANSPNLPSHHRISRVAFVTLFTALLLCTCLFMTLAIDSPESIWVLSVGVGIAYGSIFTLLPSIVSSIWGVTSMGRNFGALTYAPFLGTPIFSYLYAYISARHSTDGGVCRGAACWSPTFWISCGALLAALLECLYLWRAWRGRL